VLLTAADVAYIRANYLTLDELCAGRGEEPADVRRLIAEGVLPRPSYVLQDGSEMFPSDYFRLVDEAGGPAALRAHFEDGLRAAGGDDLASDWQAYLAGIYGVCLRDVTPETIVRKARLVSSLCELLVLARPADPEWRERLRAEVEELDELEREFSPDCDRNEERLGRKPTRDLLITAARERYPDVFPSELAAR
jgi:Family of unknown function (DUF6058)